MLKRGSVVYRQVLQQICVICLGIMGVGVLHAREHVGDQASFEGLLDSVVRLDVWETIFAGGRTNTAHGVGSGVIMTPDGYILTNAHVVNPYAERIIVTLNNLERVPARLVGWDHWTDLAVVQIDLEEVNERELSFSWADFGDSSDLYPGETVYAVGTPNGLARTVTKGIVSNTNRFFEGTQVGRGFETGNFNTWLQTDAAINPGNSGGPLVLPNGQVIGINTRSYLGANNLGFAVPSNIAKQVLGDLITDSAIRRSYIGMVSGPMQDLETYYDLESNTGVLIQSIDPGSPAEAAGLRPSDIILSIDGQPVDGRFPEQLPAIRHKIASRPVGTEIDFEVKKVYMAAAERYWLGLKVTRSQCVVKHFIICAILMSFEIYNLIKFPNIVYFMSESPFFNHEGVAAP